MPIHPVGKYAHRVLPSINNAFPLHHAKVLGPPDLDISMCDADTLTIQPLLIFCSISHKSHPFPFGNEELKMWLHKQLGNVVCVAY